MKYIPSLVLAMYRWFRHMIESLQYIIFKEDYRILIQGYLRHLKLTLVLYYNNKIL